MNKKWKAIILIFIIIFVSLALTNPDASDYAAFELKEYGEPPLVASKIEIERINFILFSTYTPIYQFESGITHLGIMGKFIRISDGQFDYPFWLRFFN